MEQRLITANVTFDIYKNRHSYQWTAGNAYTATWEHGWISLTSDTGVYWFGGTEKELVHENFIFWGGNENE